MSAVTACLVGNKPLSSIPFKTDMASNDGKEIREKNQILVQKATMLLVSLILPF